ncbi:MAG: apolipoprotein N-acyltransferase [Thermodesulfovibrio sp.]|nr:apolipoprotein N-acyltransferase [Thermodesulfovibrio sp.]
MTDRPKTRIYMLFISSLLSGALLFLSFPEKDFYLLAWIALAPLLIALYDTGKKESFIAGLLTGIVYFFGTTYWIYHSLYRYGSIHLIPSMLIVFLLCLYLSLYPALFSFAYSVLIKKTTLPALFIAPVLWTTLEFIRSYALTGFPWSSLGYSQYNFLHFIQIADVTGIYGISFLLVAFNGGIADLFLLNKKKMKQPLYSFLPTVTGFILLFIVLIATFSYGSYRLHQNREGRNLKISIVQGNIEQDKKWDAAYQQAVFDVYKDLSTVASQGKPDMIVWPETSVPFVFGGDRVLTENLVSFHRQLDSYLLFGSILLKDSANSRYSNGAVLLDRDGKVSYIYDKIYLVPFGEYVPLRNILFFVDKLTYGIGDYVPGDSYIKAVTPFGSFGTLICYEIIFPGLVRKFYTHGGDFIVTITNDAWFGDTGGPYQHFDMAVFRAIENRKPVIRAANTGISGFIDSNGRIMDKTQLFKRTVLFKEIKTDRTMTVYTKYGDLFSYLCIVLFMLLIIKPRK